MNRILLIMAFNLAACQAASPEDVAPPADSESSTFRLTDRHPRTTQVASGYVDAQGVDHELTADTRTRARVRAQTDYPDCEFDYSDSSQLMYRGYTTTRGNGVRTLRVSWTHDLPANIQVLPNSTNSYARVRLTNAPGCGTSGANTTAPLSVTQTGTYIHGQTGLEMKRYEVAHELLISDGDFTQFAGFSATYRLMTDCSALGAVYPLTQSDIFSPMSLVAAGNQHSLAIRTDANIWGSGESGYGQLGDDGDNPDGYLSAPIRVSAMTCMRSAAASYFRSMGLKRDGTVWGWGNNFFGQLGLGTRSSAHFTPTQVADLSGIVDISAGPFHSIALAASGHVWTWGNGYAGRLGDGQEVDSYVPVLALVPTGIIAVSAGGAHNLALKSDGTVWVWGSSGTGNGTVPSPLVPFQVPGLSQIIAISAGEGYSLVLKSDGTVWAWGYNSHGQLGDGTTTTRALPIQIPNLTNVVSISAGTRHSLALASDGRVWSWGLNGSGQLGDGSFGSRYSPGWVADISGVVAISAGYEHSLALRADGTVWAWGSNVNGALGNGASGNSYRTPTPSLLR